jgi:hypothetical protein
MANNFPPVNKIFDDLDKFRDFCRFEGEGYPFDERNLYNANSGIWQAYQRFVARKNRNRYNNNNNYNNNNYNNSKPYNKPRNFNRSQ